MTPIHRVLFLLLNLFWLILYGNLKENIDSTKRFKCMCVIFEGNQWKYKYTKREHCENCTFSPIFKSLFIRTQSEHQTPSVRRKFKRLLLSDQQKGTIQIKLNEMVYDKRKAFWSKIIESTAVKWRFLKWKGVLFRCGLCCDFF